MDHDQLTLFRKSWTLYDAIAAENCMFHRELYGRIGDLFTKRHESGPFRLLDLGCGNARFLAPCLEKSTPLRYDGVDLSPVALEEARDHLSGFEGVIFHEEDMVEHVNSTEERYDLVFTGYAVHHLAPEQKARLFEGCAACVDPGGEILMIDVLREEGQELGDYLASYLRLMREEWTAIPAEMIEEACEHVAAHDQPASFSELSSVARSVGWTSAEILERHGPHHLLRFFR